MSFLILCMSLPCKKYLPGLGRWLSWQGTYSQNDKVILIPRIHMVGDLHRHAATRVLPNTFTQTRERAHTHTHLEKNTIELKIIFLHKFEGICCCF